MPLSTPELIIFIFIETFAKPMNIPLSIFFHLPYDINANIMMVGIFYLLILYFIVFGCSFAIYMLLAAVSSIIETNLNMPLIFSSKQSSRLREQNNAKPNREPKKVVKKYFLLFVKFLSTL
ncbi:uncharacterized protein DS421_10g313910 [Arachis hypogaea]|nr:uncharacterized protein DS421_10g313910 [Arachis hypogaea]